MHKLDVRISKLTKESKIRIIFICYDEVGLVSLESYGFIHICNQIIWKVSILAYILDFLTKLGNLVFKITW